MAKNRQIWSHCSGENGMTGQNHNCKNIRLQQQQQQVNYILKIKTGKTDFERVHSGTRFHKQFLV